MKLLEVIIDDFYYVLMEKELNPEEKALIAHFADVLALTRTIDEMFPPDGAPVREPLNPRPPIMPCSEQICLAAVYDLTRARKNKMLKDKGLLILRSIDELLPA